MASNVLVPDILLTEETCFNSMLSLIAAVTQMAARGGHSVNDQLIFAAYVWYCVKSASENYFTALALISPGKNDDRHAKTHLRRQVINRFNQHFDSILKVSHILFDLGDKSLQPFWYKIGPPNILSPIHLCAQSIYEEVSSDYDLANS